jgi:N-acetyl-anhydromuramyl-L-alanine amidase AmpD
MQVKNVINELPWHPTRKWRTRNLNEIDTIVVHQSASGGTAESINRYHITPTSDRNNDGIVESWERNHISDEGIPHIAYHYAIENSGDILLCNNLTDITWHAGVGNYNQRSIGIVVIGNFNGPSYTGTDTPTAEQIKSLRELLDFYKNKHIPEVPIISLKRFYGHCDVKVAKENCPGNFIMAFLRAYRGFY